MTPKWTILTLTQDSRYEYLRRLEAFLNPQILSLPKRAAVVSWFISYFNPRLSLGENRQRLIEVSHAEYVCFVDDDDLVAPDYVSTILPLLDRDYVGFKVQLYNDGVPDLPTYHSLVYDHWFQNEHGYYRHISHLNPIRRELALLVPMEGGVGEDHRWADRLYATGKVRTEHFIDRVMYHYYSRSVKNDVAFRWEPPASSSL